MNESPIFARVHDLLLWLIPRTLRFPREHRFILAKRIQDRAFDLQEYLLEAALSRGTAQHRLLQRADVTLAQLRYHLRLAHELTLLSQDQYGHVVGLVAEIGRLLGGWQKKAVPATRAS
jgi:hypothetical protein